MCREHHSHRTEGNCYLCRAVQAEAAQTQTDEADDE